MRMVWLVLSVKCLAFLAAPVNAQAQETRFDPTPVSLPRSSPGPMRTVTVQDLLGLRQVYGVGISPDGSKIAFVAGEADHILNSYRTAVFVMRTTSDEAPRCLGSAGTPHWDAIHQWIPEAPQWSRDSRSFTYRMRMGNEDSWQVWRWNGHSDRLTQLTHVPGDVLSYRRKEAARKLILTIKRPVGAREGRMSKAQGIHYDQRFTPWQGMPAILANLSEETRATETWIHDLGTDEERTATAEEEQTAEPSTDDLQRLFDEHRPAGSDVCRVERPRLGPDGHTVAFLCFTENTNDTGVLSWNLFSADLLSQDVRRVTSRAYTVSDYWWSTDSRFLYYVAIRGDGRSNSVDSYDVQTTTTKLVYTGPDFLKQFSMDRTGRFIACTRETNRLPAEIAILDLSRSRLSTRANLNPEFVNIRLGEPERIAGVNRYGEEWFGHVVKPPDYQPGKKYPLIVTTYRSGDYFLLGASGDENPIQSYAANGFAVLSFDIGRLRNRRLNDFADRLLEWKSPTESLREAIALLTKSGLVDPARTGIAGFSHGAEIVEYAISHTSVFHAATLSGPAARDPYFYYMAGTSWQETFDKWGLGGWPEGPSSANWKQLSASLNVDRIETPVLVNASDSEYIASLSLVTSLQQLKKPVDLFIYPDELHVKNGPRHRYEIYERNVDWFRFWLKGEEDPSPEKSSQYEYWRKLRADSAPPSPSLVPLTR